MQRAIWSGHEAGSERWALKLKQDAGPGEGTQRDPGRWSITREEDKKSVWENGGQGAMDGASAKPKIEAHVIGEINDPPDSKERG